MRNRESEKVYSECESIHRVRKYTQSEKGYLEWVNDRERRSEKRDVELESKKE